MDPQSAFIPVRFDKSHLSAIGQRLYTQSLDLIRELVANAYDADARVVKITADDRQLTVEDDGSGMDRAGLEQYFTIGSPYKKLSPVSRRFKRQRIGEFGIGKFAVLSLCDRFELYSNSGQYAATVIFDKGDFEKRSDWSVPIVEHQTKNEGKTGSRVSLHDLKKPVSLFDLERYLINLFPLTDKDFAIYLNGKRLAASFIPGERFKIDETIKYGRIKGEFIIASLLLPKEYIGIGIRVKGVLIKRDTFKIESHHSVSTQKLTGEIAADFLPITTGRNDFITDTPEYEEFIQVVSKKLRRVIRSLEKRSASYKDKKAEKILSDALLMIRTALRKNRDIFITGDLPLFSRSQKRHDDDALGDSVITTALTQKTNSKKESSDEKDLNKILKEAVKKLRPKIRGRVKTLLRDEQRIVKKVKIGGAEFLVSFAHLGSEEKESFVEGGIIFINRDHKLFQQVEKKSELAFYHLIRLVAQELIKFAAPRNLDAAFDWQGKLIKDAFLSMREPPDHSLNTTV